MSADLLRLYTTSVSWAERGCMHKTWRAIGGEGVAGQAEPEVPPPQPTPGGLDGRSQLTLPNFEIDHILGEGNYSQVFTAILKPTRERYAFKVVDKSKVQRYKKQDEVVVEKWVLSHVHHPSIIRIFQTFQDRMSLYLVLEHVPGGELWSLTHKRGLPVSLAAFYGAQLLEALQHLHEAGVVHRDIKPENVLLSKTRHIKLIDFGTAKVMDESINLGGSGKWKNFVGTPEYMSPEAINNKYADYRSDLWSLGNFICQTLAGMPPFRGGSDYLTFKRVIGRHFLLPEGMPADAADVIGKLVALEPKERLGGAGEIDAPEADRHGALRAHPFFQQRVAAPFLNERALHKAPVPIPKLSELAAPRVADLVASQGAAGLGNRAAAVAGAEPSEWAAAVRTQVTFELHKSDRLSEEARGALGLGPAPAPIDDQALLAEDTGGDESGLAGDGRATYDGTEEELFEDGTEV